MHELIDAVLKGAPVLKEVWKALQERRAHDAKVLSDSRKAQVVKCIRTAPGTIVGELYLGKVLELSATELQPLLAELVRELRIFEPMPGWYSVSWSGPDSAKLYG